MNKKEFVVIAFIGILVSLFVISYVSFQSPEEPQPPEFSTPVVDDRYDNDVIAVYDDEGEMVCYFLRSDSSLETIGCHPIEQTNYTSSDFKNR